MIDLSGDECNIDSGALRADSLRWFLIQSVKSIHYNYDSKGRPRLFEFGKSGSYCSERVSPLHVIGFVIEPGAGCEPANVGLRLLPMSLNVRARDGANHGTLKVGTGWDWSAHCKTQYASNPGEGGSIENFLRCHLSIVAMLDRASELGFDLDVSDERGFYENRDVDVFLKELGHQNAMIAGLGGMLKDVVDPNGEGKLKSPMFSHPDFERMEMKGRSMIDPALAELIAKVIKKKTP
jgi:hypothetical protein